MPKIKFFGPTDSRPNFLASEIGLIPKTHTIPQTMGVADADYNGRLIVQVGRLYPSNDADAIGIVYPNGPDCFAYDVTDGDVEGAVMIAGRVYSDRLYENPDAAAIEALEARGLYFDEIPVMTRPNWPVED